MKTLIKGAYIVTGATGSIGKEISLALARMKKPVILACRNLDKANKVREQIINETGNRQIFVKSLALDKIESIKNFVEEIKNDGISVDGLANNAGIMLRKHTLTADKREMTFAVNYIGTLALTYLMIPLIEKGGHITFTTSVTRKLHKASTINFNESRKEFAQLRTYGRSKSALSHYAMFMAHCYPDLYINCADPGIVNSNMITMHRWYDPLANILFRPMIRTPKNGAKSTIKALMLNSSGNIVTKKKVHPMKYDIYDLEHSRLVEKTKNYLSDLGINMLV